MWTAGLKQAAENPNVLPNVFLIFPPLQFKEQFRLLEPFLPGRLLGLARQLAEERVSEACSGKPV